MASKRKFRVIATLAVVLAAGISGGCGGTAISGSIGGAGGNGTGGNGTGGGVGTGGNVGVGGSAPACDTGCPQPCVKGRCLTAVAFGQPNPWGVASDSIHVYWTNNGNPGAVMKATVGGVAQLTFVSGPDHPTAVAVKTPNVYFNSGDSVVKAGMSGGLPVELASGSKAAAIAVDSTSVYWTIELLARSRSRRRAAKLQGHPDPMSGHFRLPDWSEMLRHLVLEQQVLQFPAMHDDVPVPVAGNVQSERCDHVCPQFGDLHLLHGTPWIPLLLVVDRRGDGSRLVTNDGPSWPSTGTCQLVAPDGPASPRPRPYREPDDRGCVNGTGAAT